MKSAVEKWVPLLDRFLGTVNVIVVTCKSQLAAKQFRSQFYKARMHVYKDKELYAKYGEVLATRQATHVKCDVIFEYVERVDVRTVLAENLQ